MWAKMIYKSRNENVKRAVCVYVFIYFYVFTKLMMFSFFFHFTENRPKSAGPVLLCGRRPEHCESVLCFCLSRV